MLQATPLQYLERWRAGNRVFHEDAELLGLYREPRGLRIVMSQADVPGELPTWDELDSAFINGFGLRRLRLREALGGYEARSYFWGRIGVFDVRPANCVRTAAGLTLPIDVIPQYFNAESASVLKKLVE